MTNGFDYERGRREAALEGRVSALEAQIGPLARSVDRLETQVTNLAGSLQAREKVDQALKEAAEMVTRRTWTRREQFFAMMVMLAVVGGFILAIIQTVHG
jgi:hypothetical protein